ncbi:hypothetical protein BH10PSE7_BH10PSE7_03020 [soil metagenome]
MFEFLRALGTYKDQDIERMNLRHRYIVEANKSDIDGASVLDLASHDGRWAYAFAKAGARDVVGIEGRSELVDSFSLFPDDDARKRVDLRQGDIYEGMESLLSEGKTFDIVSILGIFYHVMDHYRLLKLANGFQPKKIIIDSEFWLANWPMVALMRESTGKNLNTTAHVIGQSVAPVGYPSRPALELMADTLGYQVSWSQWENIPREGRGPVFDYFRPEKYRRFTCTLTSRKAFA